MNYKKLMLVIALFISQAVLAQLGAKQNIVKINVLSSQNKVHPGTLLKVAMKAHIQEEWHINSNKPNDDFLIGSQVVSQDEKFPLAKIVFPQAKNLDLGFSDKPVSVFEGEIIIGLLINVDKALPLGNYNIPL